MNGGLRHRLRVQLRWRDMDRLGHLNQAVYHEILAEARIGLLTDLARRCGGDAAFVGWVVARVELDYHGEVRKDHAEIDVLARVGRVGTTSVGLDYDIVLPDGTIAASASTILVAWDPASRRKRTITDAERLALIGS
jgi:acyl-CoA thioester hydrolase